MANNQVLKSSVTNVIKQNGNQEITGDLLQQTLLAVINQFGAGAVFLGIATPTTVPANTDVNGFYFAVENGVYSNFDGYENKNNNLVVFWNMDGGFKKMFAFNIEAVEELPAIPPGQLPNVTHGGRAKMEVYGAGTWSWNGTDFVVSENEFATFWFENGNWSLNSIVALPSNAAKAVEWMQQQYLENSIVSHSGYAWRAKEDTTEEPGVGDQWQLLGVLDEWKTSVETVLDGLLDVPNPGEEKPFVYAPNRGYLYLNNSNQFDELADYKFVQNIEIPNYSLKLRLKRLPQGLGTILGITIKDGIVTDVKNLTPTTVSVGEYFDIEVLKSDYSFVSFSMPFSDAIVNVIDVGTTYPDTNILDYLDKNFLRLISDKYFKRSEGKNLQDNFNPITKVYEANAFLANDIPTYKEYETDFIDVQPGDEIHAKISFPEYALSTYDENGIKIADLFPGNGSYEVREIIFEPKTVGKIKIKNASKEFINPNYYITKKITRLTLGVEDLIYHTDSFNKFVFNANKGSIVEFRTKMPATVSMVDYRQSGVLLLGGLQSDSSETEQIRKFDVLDNYEITIYVDKNYNQPFVKVYEPIGEKYYLTPEDINLTLLNDFMENKALEVESYGIADFKTNVEGGYFSTDFIQVEAGDVIKGEVYDPLFALKTFNQNNDLIENLFPGNGSYAKRNFEYTFSDDVKIKVYNVNSTNGDPEFKIIKKNIDSTVKVYGYSDLKEHTIGISKWIVNVKKGDRVKYKTFGNFNTLDVLVNGVMIYYTGKAQGEFFGDFTFSDDVTLVIYCNQDYTTGFVEVYTPVVTKHYLTPEDAKDFKTNYTEVGNSFELEKPQTLVRLDMRTNEQLPTAKGTVISGEITIKSGAVAFKKFAEIEVQGSSSAAYPKKNWTLVFYNDEAKTSKFQLAVNNSIFINEWIYKANFIDATMLRNIGANRLWKQIELSRPGYPKRDIETMYSNLGVTAFDTRATGIVNGYPCELYVNGEFYGIGSFNLGKKRDNYNLDDKNANHIQVETGATQMDFYNMTLANGDYAYRSPKTITAAVEQKVTDFKTFAAMPQAQFNTRLPELMDVTNLVDYFIFIQIMYLPDNLGNNIMLTRWSDKFLFMPYDLDNSFGLEWNGSVIHPTNLNPIDNKPDLPANTVQFWHKVKIALSTEIAARYQQLKTDGVITENAIYTILKEMEIKFGQANYKKEFARWTLPSAGITSVQQIMSWYKQRLVWCDSYLLN